MGLIRDGKVKTRKEYKCHGCQEVIPKGTEVYHQVYTEDGGISSIYECDKCIEWCKSHDNCQSCAESEDAHKGYVKECKAYSVNYIPYD